MRHDQEASGIEIKLYKPFGSSEQACIFGHVFKKQKLKKERVSKNIFKNAWEMLKRYRVRMAAHEPLIVHLNDRAHQISTDKNGYFFLEISPGIEEGPISFTINLEKYPEVKQSGELEIMNPKQIFISDIDDTILVSHSTSLFKKIYTLLSRNHERRKPFQGVQAFYEKLSGEKNSRVFFYVSSSEWNLYDFIDNFCRFHDLPEGIFLLNNMKIGLRQVMRSGGGTHQHKFEKIRLIRDTFRDASLTLIGDSGQKDPEIYEKIAMESPDRIKEIYIRDLHKRKRKKLMKKQRKLSQYDISMHLFN